MRILAAFLVTLPVTAMPAAAQMLSKCEIGMRVVDEQGIEGVVALDESGTCTLKLDDGSETYRMFYVLRPAEAATADAAGPLADGEYDCAISGLGFSNGVMSLGRMDIAGLTYRFRPYGDVTDDFASYAVGSDGTLTWAGNIGPLTEAPSEIISSQETPEGFNIVYRTAQGADSDTMSCHHI